MYVLFEAPTVAELSDSACVLLQADRLETVLWAKSAQPSSTEIDLEVSEL